MQNRKFRKNDYVVFDYEGDKFNAKVLDVTPEGYLIAIYIDTVDNDQRLMQELVVPEYKLSAISINLAQIYNLISRIGIVGLKVQLGAKI